MRAANARAYRNNGANRLGTCKYCSQTIYWCLGRGGWKPLESWVAGNCSEGEFIPHNCRG